MQLNLKSNPIFLALIFTPSYGSPDCQKFFMRSDHPADSRILTVSERFSVYVSSGTSSVYRTASERLRAAISRSPLYSFSASLSILRAVESVDFKRSSNCTNVNSALFVPSLSSLKLELALPLLSEREILLLMQLLVRFV